MVAMLWSERWRRFAKLMAVGAAGLTLVACGGSSTSSDDDDNAGSGASPSDGGTGGGTGGATGKGGASGKGGAGGSTGGNGTGGAPAGGGVSGSAAVGGSGTTTNVYVNQIRPGGINKVDLLLMVDNSLSMADKQQLLADAVPLLVARLITPQCADANGNPTGESADEMGHCDSGAPEFEPIRDLHIGVITSSLGDHGSEDVCSDAQNAQNVEQGAPASQFNDFAQLMPSVRPDSHLVSWNNSGFLVWDPRDQDQVTDPHANLTANETEPGTFTDALQAHVTSAGERGCGYEGSLESWYRFLVDPEPISNLTHDTSTSVSVRGQVNQVVLQQRKSFLRSDSALVILMMSDENDCSIIDENGGQGWLVGYKGGVNGSSLWHMPRATSSCASDPNDPCCYPCASGDRGGCPSISADSACSLGPNLSINEDSMNLRCFDQVGRFGVELLYPVQRYIDGLTQSTITPRFGGPSVPNPLFAPGPNVAYGRDPSSVIVAGILGVPWQDLATEDSWDGRDLTYLDTNDLEVEGRWDVILGDPSANVPPTDTLMVESIDPRTSGYSQVHPLVGASIGADNATTRVNPINGHEHPAGAIRSDLQYACIFELPVPVPCNDANADSCACNYDDFDSNSPLCEGWSATTDGTQTHGKAYPSLRELEVLRGVGYYAVAASICAKNVEADGTPATDPAYGYNPAVTAVVAKLKEQLTPKCLPRPLQVLPDDPGRVNCRILEATPSPDGPGVCPCDAPGRTVASDELRAFVGGLLQQLSACDVTGQGACSDLCVCELAQLDGDELASCQAGDADQGQSYGFCYIDPEQGAGSEAAVVSCKATDKRLLRFMGEDVPDPNGYTFVACASNMVE